MKAVATLFRSLTPCAIRRFPAFHCTHALSTPSSRPALKARSFKGTNCPEQALRLIRTCAAFTTQSAGKALDQSSVQHSPATASSFTAMCGLLATSFSQSMWQCGSPLAISDRPFPPKSMLLNSFTSFPAVPWLGTCAVTVQWSTDTARRRPWDETGQQAKPW